MLHRSRSLIWCHVTSHACGIMPATFPCWLISSSLSLHVDAMQLHALSTCQFLASRRPIPHQVQLISYVQASSCSWQPPPVSDRPTCNALNTCQPVPHSASVLVSCRYLYICCRHSIDHRPAKSVVVILQGAWVWLGGYNGQGQGPNKIHQ